MANPETIDDWIKQLEGFVSTGQEEEFFPRLIDFAYEHCHVFDTVDILDMILVLGGEANRLFRDQMGGLVTGQAFNDQLRGLSTRGLRLMRQVAPGPQARAA